MKEAKMQPLTLIPAIIGDGSHYGFVENEVIRRFEHEWEKIASRKPDTGL